MRPTRSSGAPTERQDAGFALAMVVFLLFAAAIGGLAGYQVVSGEATLSSGNENTNVALDVASGGLKRYVGERVGLPGTATYAVGRGSATITPRRIARMTDSTDLYLLESVGTVTDPRYPTSPASRTVRQYAYLNTMPVKPIAALMAIENTVNFSSPFQVSGYDVSGGCTTTTSYPVVGGTFNTAAIGGTGTAGTGTNTTNFLPNTVSAEAGQFRRNLGANASDVIAMAKVRWPVVSDANFDLPFINVMPNFATIGADSFPAIRMTGNYTLNSTGRGVLIVNGVFTAGPSMNWSGIILAGDINNGSSLFRPSPGAYLAGMMVAGMDGVQNNGGDDLLVKNVTILFNACHVRKANRSLAYLTLIGRARADY